MADRFGTEYRYPHSGNNIFDGVTPRLPNTTPMRSPFPERNSAIYDWRTPRNTGNDYSTQYPNGRYPRNDGRPPAGGVRVPRNPMSPKGSGGASVAQPSALELAARGGR